MFFELDRGENPNFFFLNLIDLPGNKEGEDRFRGIGFPRAGSASGLVSVWSHHRWSSIKGGTSATLLPFPSFSMALERERGENSPEYPGASGYRRKSGWNKVGKLVRSRPIPPLESFFLFDLLPEFLAFEQDRGIGYSRSIVFFPSWGQSEMHAICKYFSSPQTIEFDFLTFVRKREREIVCRKNSRSASTN